MAVTTKKTFNAVGSGGQGTTTFTPVGIELNNQDDLDVYVTLSGGTRVLQYNQSTGSTTDSNHPQVNDTTGLYFPAQSAGVTLYNYTISTDNNTITFNSALPSGAVVSIERRTRDSSGDYTNFAGGSTIRHTDVNAAFDESNFTAQEARNKVFELEGILFDGEAKDTLDVDGIDLDDNEKVRFGTHNDAEIYHGGTNTRFKNDKGDLIIACGSDDIRLAAKDDIYLEVNATDSDAGTTENGIIVHGNAAVKLHYDNVEKFKTSSTGAILYGVLQADGLSVGDNEKILVGNSDDLQIYHDGAPNNVTYINNNTGDLYIQNTDTNNNHNIYIKAKDDENSIICNDDGSIELYHNGNKKFETSSTGATLTGVLIADGLEVGNNEEIKLGASEALRIYHDTAGTNYIKSLSHILRLRSDQLILEAANGENLVKGLANGQAELYFDNVIKLNTTSTGATVTGVLVSDGLSVGDNEKILVGNGDDLRIHHNGTNSFIKNYEGDLYIQNDAGNADKQLYLRARGDENSIICKDDGAVELYYDDSQKFQTSANGIVVTGTVFADAVDLGDNEKIRVGDSNDLQIYHGNNDSFINNTAGHLYIQNVESNDDSNIYIRARNEDSSIICKDDGAVELFHDGTKKFETRSGGVWVQGVVDAHDGYHVGSEALNLGHLANVHNATPSDGQVLKWINANSRWEPAQDSGAGGASLSDGDYGEITVASSGSSFTIDNDVITGAKIADDAVGAEHIEVLDAALQFGDSVKAQFGTDNDLEIYHDGSNSYLSHNGTGDLFIDADGSQENINLRSKKNVNIYVEDKTELAVKCDESGSVELYYDGSPKVKTTASGIELTPTSNNHGITLKHTEELYPALTFDVNRSGSDQFLGNIRGNWNGTTVANILLETGGDTTNKDNGRITFRTAEAGSPAERLRIDSAGRILAGTTSTTADTRVMIQGRSDNNTTTGTLHIQRGAANPANNSGLGKIIFADNASAEGAYIYAQAAGQWASNDYPTRLSFATTSDDASSAVERLRITASGDVRIPNDTGKFIAGTSQDLKIYHDGSHSFIRHDGNGSLLIKADAADEDIYIDAGQNLHLRTTTSFESAISCIANGGVKLYYNGSTDPKLETTSSGATITAGGDPQAALDSSPVKLVLNNDSAHSWSEDEHCGAIIFRKGGNIVSGITATHTRTGGVHSNEDGGIQIWTSPSAQPTVPEQVWEFDSVGHFIGKDNHRIRLGDQDDLELWHDGTDSYIDSGTGDLRIDADSLKVRSKTNSETLITATLNGSVELYYNDNPKFWTDGSGTETIGRSLWFSNADEDEGEVRLRPWGTADNNNRLWIGTRDTSSSKYRFCVDGDGEVRSNSANFIGVQRSDADSPANHFNSADRIRYSAFRGTSDNANYRSRMVAGCASSDWDDYRVFYYVDSQDDAAVDYDQDQTVSFSGSGRGNFKSNVWSGRVESDEGSPNSVYAQAERGFAAFADDGTDQTTCMARNVADGTHVYMSEVNNEANFSVSAEGEVKADETDSLSNADYAESFEWTDGNTSSQERRGMTVVLDGEKVKLATDSDNKDNIIGVVSPNPAVLGDSASLGWHGRYKRDIYGTPIRKPQEWLVWRREYTYVDGVKTLCKQPDPTNPKSLEHGDVERMKVEDIEKFKAKNLIPDFAITNNIRYTSYGKDIDTTDYDPTRAYIPRKDRKEWDAIGMVGKLIVRRGQPVGTRWLLMKENIGTDTDGTVLDRYLVR